METDLVLVIPTTLITNFINNQKQAPYFLIKNPTKINSPLIKYSKIAKKTPKIQEPTIQTLKSITDT